MINKSHWSQPSISRDFAMLSGVILFCLAVLSVWIIWFTYNTQSRRIMDDLRKEATRIDNTLTRELGNTEFLLRAMGKQVKAIPPSNLHSIAQLLQAYHLHNGVVAMWAWTNENQKLSVSSNIGILEQPVDVSDREHIQKAISEPGQIQIANPIDGRVSKRWVIPTSIGITDETGKYSGTLAASVDIGVITKELSYLVKRDGISFAVISKSLVQLTEVSDTPDFVAKYFPKSLLESLDIKNQPYGIVSRGSLFSKNTIYAYYQVSNRYPYILLVGYDNSYSEGALRALLMPRLFQMIALATFLLIFLWIVRVRVLKPVIELEKITADIARGKSYKRDMPKGPIEIDALAVQIAKVSDYITEKERLEVELHTKLDELMKRESERIIAEQRITSE